MKKWMKQFVAMVLMISILTGILPVEGIAMLRARAQAEEQGQQAETVVAETAMSFADVAALAQQRLASDGPRDDGEWQYVLLPEYGYAVVTGHHDTGASRVDVPAVLGGADVVALLSGVFAQGHEALLSVTMAHNVYYAAPDALPRGVAVRGYHGSYAQSWAENNRAAFENMSELDFVTGVVDLSDVAQAYFTRHDERSVTLRALEANRLKAGSIFFLADPENLYAISFYQVESISAAENGYVTLTCTTPDISRVLNSIELQDSPMMPDWDTMQLDEDMQQYADTLQVTEREKSKQSFGFHFTPEIEIGKKGKFKGDVGYDISSTVTAKYANFELQSFEIQNREGLTLSGEISVKSSLFNEDNVAEDEKADELLDAMIQKLRDQGKAVHKEELKVKQKLCSVTLFSLYGVLNFTLDVNLNVEFSGSVKLTYTSSTVTTYKYYDQELTSKSRKDEESIELKAEAEIKAGLGIGLKIKVFALEVAKLELFIGFKGTASYSIGAKAATDEYGEISSSLMINAVETGEMPIATLNMLDCILLEVSFLIELEARIGNDSFTIYSGEFTLLEIPIAKFHCHFLPFKYCWEGIGITREQKTASEVFHFAEDCPLMDAISLWVQEISTDEPVGTYTLFGGEEIYFPISLELPDYKMRVKEWYLNEELTKKVEWPLKVKSGDKLWGDTEDVAVYTVVGYDGKPLEKTLTNEPAVYCLGETETLTISKSNFVDGDHIVGWVLVEAADNPEFLEEVSYTDSYELVGGTEKFTLLAIRDNDLTVVFKSIDGTVIDTLTWGHFLEITEEQVPAFEPEYDPSYAIATYEWRDPSGDEVTFPLMVTDQSREKLTLVRTPTGIKRVFEADDSTTVIGTIPTLPDGLASYGTETYFQYSDTGSSVRINGFKHNQSYEDENGEIQYWTVDPEVIHVPAYINGNPVVSISNEAFSGIDSLVAVYLPETLKRIGSNAFEDCPNLMLIDMSACTSITEVPQRFASGDTSLVCALLPNTITKLDNFAFYGCTSLASVEVNADIGISTFEGCASLSSIELKYGVTSIDGGAFRDCTALTSLVVPCSAAEVGNNFIAGCTALTDLTLDGAPAKVTENIMYIGPDSSLANLTLTLGVTHVGEYAFANGSYGNPNLTSITLPEAMSEVGNRALDGTAVEYLHVYDLGMIGIGFARYCETLKELSFEKGVINNYAFMGCTNLEKITMGDQVFAIGNYAFEGCTSLKEITMGKGVESIGKNAFAGCKALETVVLGDALLELGDRAFYGCSAIEELVIPPQVEKIGNEVLSDCTSLKKLTIGGEGCPYLDGWNWLGYIEDSVLETVIIGEGVTTLGVRALANCIGLESTAYGNAGHQNLTTVVLPSTLETIERQAFSEAKTLPVLKLPASLKSIGERAFEYCEALQLDCVEEMQLVNIGEGAFINCKSLISIHTGSELKTLGERAFEGCTALKSLVVPPSVETIGENFIADCTALTSLTIGGPNQAYFDGWNVLGYIEDSKLETIIIGEGVTTLGTKALANCIGQESMAYGNGGHKNLTTLVLPSTLEVIEEQAIAEAAGLGMLKLPSSLVYIGPNAFESCFALQLDCPEDLQLEYIGNRAFHNCKKLTSINLGSELVTLGDEVFVDCESLESLVVPPSVENIGIEIIAGCTSLKSLTIGGPNQAYFDGWNWLGHIDDSALETIVIGEGVVTLGTKALANCVGRESMAYVNHGHLNLTKLVLPSTLQVIEEQAVSSNDALGLLKLPASVVYIGESAFDCCYNLQLDCSADMQLEYIGTRAFARCTSLKSINLGSRLKTIGDKAFVDCTSLKSMEVPASAQSIGTEFLAGCTALESLMIGGPALTEFDGWNWLGYIEDSVLETVIIREGVTKIGPKALANSYGLESMAYVNKSHSKLRYVSLPSTLREIGEQAFASMPVMTEITIPDGVTYIHPDAFNWSDALTTMHTNQYSAVVEAFARSSGRTYVADKSQAVLNLMLDGSEIAATVVDIGASMAAVLAKNQPADSSGMTFAGWYMDESCTIPWRGSLMPSFALTLHAKMATLHTASFVTLTNGVKKSISTVKVGEGLVIPWPEEPVAGGYCFEGWYTDAAMTAKMDPNMKMGQTDITLYGKMTTRSAGTVYTAVSGGLMLTKYILQEGESTEVWLPSVVNGKQVVAIAESAFDEAEEITALHLPDSLVTIQEGALDALTNLQSITASTQCVGYTAVNNVLYTADMGTLVCVPQGRTISHLYVPEGVHTIGRNAVINQQWLTYVDLGSDVTVLADGAFAGCHALETFRAMGLESIGIDAIPTISNGMKVYGPVKEGVLRAYFLLKEGDLPVFQTPYNLYFITLYVDGWKRATIGLEAGSTLPVDYIYGELDSDTVITTWYTDEDMTIAWDANAASPASDMNLYAPWTPLYAYEEIEYETENGETKYAAKLTAYYGTGGALVLPESIDGLTVMALGENILAQCAGVVSSVRIGSAVTQIDDTALVATETYPFGGVVYADTGSYAAEWAESMGYTVKGGSYTIDFETFGGAVIASKQAAAGTYVRVPTPVLTGCTFLGWYLDEDLTEEAVLEDGCYVTPARDVTLYAAWDGVPTTWPFTYEETENGIVITEYTGFDTELTIPDTVNGIPVVSVDDYAFIGASLTQLTLPATVQTIGMGAFLGSSLESIDLGGVTALGERAFSGCSALSNVTMTMVETIGSSTFADCTKLSSIHLPATLTEINASAFEGCIKLNAFTAEEGGTFTAQDGILIKNDTLWRYPQAKVDDAYALPEGVTRIGENAFRDVAFLKDIQLHAELESIGAHAFANCSKLTTVAIPEGAWIGTIPEGAFSGCDMLSSVSLGTAVVGIAANAFADCEALAQIEIPQTVTTIDTRAFAGIASNALTIVGSYKSEAWSFAMEQGYFFIDPSLVQVTEIAITSAAECIQGETIPLMAEVTPNGAQLYGEMKWTSSNESVLYVADGQAHAIGVGTAMITATAPNGVSVSMQMMVNPRPIALSATSLTMMAGQKLVLSVDMPLGGESPACTWTTSDPAVATVEGGCVIALAAGSTEIICTSADGRILAAVVQVVDDLATMTLSSALSSVEDEAFMGVSAVERIILGEGVTVVGQLAFAQCDALVQVQLPAGDVSIAQDALEGSKHAVLVCSEGSAAHSYAKENVLPYVLIVK